MKNPRHTVPALLAAILIPASAQTYAQAATLDDCQAIQDRLARYACYDSWDAASGVVRQSVPRPSSAPRQEQAEDETSLFGRVFDRDADDEPEQQPQVGTQDGESSIANFGRPQSNARIIEGTEGSELIDRVAALEQLGPSLWIITLEGGQQWKQMISKRYNLTVGDEIRIYPTRWGSSYRLASERIGGYIQVERIDAIPTAVAGTAPVPRAEQPQPARQQEEAQDENEEGSLLGRIFNRDSDGDEAPAPRQATTEPAGTTVEAFGRPQSEARVIEGSDGKSELIDTIAALEQLGPSLWLVTLEGGQQWQQMISKRYNLNVGDEVRIYPTRWGSSYRLTSSRVGSYIQVERVD